MAEGGEQSPQKKVSSGPQQKKVSDPADTVDGMLAPFADIINGMCNASIVWSY